MEKRKKKSEQKKWTIAEEHALEHLIEETLTRAYADKDFQDEAEGHHHFEIKEEAHSKKKLKSKEEKISEFKKLAEDEKILKQVQDDKAKRDLKIPGVRKSDGSECCGGSCCTTEAITDFKPHLSKKEYFDLINSVMDPETGIGISDMGLIYDVVEKPDGLVEVKMTLTSMGCPAGAQITTEIDSWLRLQKHIKDVKINIVWDPPWTVEMMNPDIKAMMFGN